ncbi:MAG: CAP domain-containing protein, partial [Ruminococcus sp.]|nr:CAP domain-containing protein [Ruminococcus sp.]
FAKMANNVAYLINEERKKLGVKQLYVVPYLNECAEIRAKDQLEQEGHWRPNGDYFSDVIDIKIIPWLYTAENIALGTANAEDTVKYWKNSSNHWKNAVSDNFSHTGVGVYYDENSTRKWHWVQIFTNDSDPYKIYPDQYLPQYINPYDKLVIKCIDSETGENISGIRISLMLPANTTSGAVKTSDFSATQNGVEISVPIMFGDDWVQFTTGEFPTEISGVSSCELRIALYKSHVKTAKYNYSHGLDEEDSSRYFSIISVRNEYQTHEFTIVLTKQY